MTLQEYTDLANSLSQKATDKFSERVAEVLEQDADSDKQLGLLIGLVAARCDEFAANLLKHVIQLTD